MKSGLSSTFGSSVNNIEKIMGTLLLQEAGKIDCDMQVVDKLLEDGANLNERDEDGNTPLIIAVVTGNAPLILALIDKGAPLADQNKAGQTASYIATLTGNPELIERLEDVVKTERLKDTVKFFNKGTPKLS